ncbi:hypothetical protein [Kitasatospora sp. NPDC085879]|uniref:hypothetical protein n=1 Tax=Kitasatospora sp. NPDC085879 TaxID=3154769 RepID=UPI00342E0DD0
MFEELLRTPAGRAEHGTQVFFVALDLLGAPGEGCTERPLAERWDPLPVVLAERGCRRTGASPRRAGARPLLVPGH